MVTPCFIIDKQELDRSIQGFQKALSDNFEHSIVGYSVKTNSLPWCLKEANRLEGYAEVVSYDEYELALACGYQKQHIIYNGPMKSHDSFIDAVENGAIVNIETHREIAWLKELAKDKMHKVGIRLNINISKISPEDADGDNDNSRFGFCLDNGDFDKAINIIHSLGNVQLEGLHIHRTSHARRVEFYENIVAYASEVIQKHHLRLRYLDIGGGYYGIFENHPTYKDYSDGFYRILKQYGLENLLIIVEPGNGLVASAFSFLSSVIDCKQVDDVLFVTTDGSRNDIDPFFNKKDYMKTIIRQEDNRLQVALQSIVGCTCLEYDRLFSIENQPELKMGDRVLYHNVGAYTLTLSPQFIRLWPRVYAFDGQTYMEVRRAGSSADMIATSI